MRFFLYFHRNTSNDVHPFIVCSKQKQPQITSSLRNFLRLNIIYYVNICIYIVSSKYTCSKYVGELNMNWASFPYLFSQVFAKLHCQSFQNSKGFTFSNVINLMITCYALTLKSPILTWWYCRRSIEDNEQVIFVTPDT